MTDEQNSKTPETPAETPESPAPGAAPQQPEQYTVPPVPPVRRLVRRPEGKVIAGVCSGLAAYTGVDPVMWRIAFVVTALVGGVGIVAYPIAWLVLPMAAEGDPLPPPPAEHLRVGRWVGLGLITLGALIFFNRLWHLRGGIFWGLVLLGAGVALWGRELLPESMRPRPRPPATPPPPGPSASTAPTAPLSPATPPTTPPSTPTPTTPMMPPPSTSYRAAQASARDTQPLARSAAPTPSPGPVRPARRESSVLGRLVVGAAALAVGVLFLLDNTGTLQLSAPALFAVLTGIVGLGLLIGTFWGRARWLIFPGVVLVFALTVTSLVPTGFVGNYGQTLWQPVARADIKTVYRQGAGQAVLDLSKIKPDNRTRSIKIEEGAGQLLVVVPKKVPVRVTARVVAGQIGLFGRKQNGFIAEDATRVKGTSDLKGYRIDIRMGFGEIVVRRTRSSDDFTNVQDAFNDFDHNFRVEIKNR